MITHHSPGGRKNVKAINLLSIYVKPWQTLHKFLIQIS